MRVTILATAAAIALAAGIGSVSAAGPLTTLNGIKAVPMSPAELNTVKGMHNHFRILLPAEGNYPGSEVGTGYLNPETPLQADPLDFCSANPDSCARIETNHYQEENGQGNFIDVTINGQTFTVSPSYLGLAQAGCNGVIVFPYNGTMSFFCQ